MWTNHWPLNFWVLILKALHFLFINNRIEDQEKSALVVILDTLEYHLSVEHRYEFPPEYVAVRNMLDYSTHDVRVVSFINIVRRRVGHPDYWESVVQHTDDGTFVSSGFFGADHDTSLFLAEKFCGERGYEITDRATLPD